MHLLRTPRALTQEYAGVFLLRYPKLREAYEEFLNSAQQVTPRVGLGVSAL
jgi:hypothetical protein